MVWFFWLCLERSFGGGGGGTLCGCNRNVVAMLRGEVNVSSFVIPLLYSKRGSMMADIPFAKLCI